MRAHDTGLSIERVTFQSLLDKHARLDRITGERLDSLEIESNVMSLLLQISRSKYPIARDRGLSFTDALPREISPLASPFHRSRDLRARSQLESFLLDLIYDIR